MNTVLMILADHFRLAVEPFRIAPQPGPQVQAFHCRADVMLYGGMAGSGKTWYLTTEPMRHIDVPGFGAIIFRRLTTEIKGAGSIWEEAQGIYRHFNGKFREGQYLDCKFPSGASIEFSHLQLERTKYEHKSKQYCLIEFDELTGFTETQFWYMFSRNRSTCGISPYMRAGTNPDASSWVRKLVDWWIGKNGFAMPERSGVLRYLQRVNDEIVWADSEQELLDRYPELAVDWPSRRPKSFTFISGQLSDNKKLLERDPSYRGRIMMLDRVERERLLGNWNIMPHAGSYFKRQYFKILEYCTTRVLRRVRGWDKAATEPTETNPNPDWTRGVKLALLEGGQIIVEDVASCRLGPPGVDELLRRTALADGDECEQSFWIDPGQAGKVDRSHTQGILNRFHLTFERASKSKIVYAGPVSSCAEAGGLLLLDGPWVEEFINELEAFPSKLYHDDIVDGLSKAYRALTMGSTESIDDFLVDGAIESVVKL